jgi:phospholipase C
MSNWGILILVALSLGVTRKIQAVGVESPAPDCSREAGSLPDPSPPPGAPDPSIPIEHVVVIMQENRSFDHYFGQLNQFGYNGEVDGLTD